MISPNGILWVANFLRFVNIKTEYNRVPYENPRGNETTPPLISQ